MWALIFAHPPRACLNRNVHVAYLHELVERMVVGAIDFKFAEDLHIGVWLPSVARSDVHNTVEQFVVFGRLLQVELIARERKDSEVLRLVLVDHTVEVKVLLGVR
jgi:hypothetical protein